MPFACLVAVHGNRTEWKDPGDSWPGQDWKRGGHPDAVLWDEGKRSLGLSATMLEMVARLRGSQNLVPAEKMLTN